jgi:hypothetical protein
MWPENNDRNVRRNAMNANLAEKLKSLRKEKIFRKKNLHSI